MRNSPAAHAHPQDNPNSRRLAELRTHMRASKLQGYIIPRGDEYLGEFVADYAERLSFLTGFTGSAGIAIVLNDSACLFVDGRYALQARNEVDIQEYEIANIMAISPGDWLTARCESGLRIGYDPWLHSVQAIEKWTAALAGTGVELVPVETNLIDFLWADQPASPKGGVFLFDETIAGRSVSEKYDMVAQALREASADAQLICQPDVIAWLLNIRGDDIPYTPLALSYAVIRADIRQIDWFIAEEKVPGAVRDHLGALVDIRPPELLPDYLEGLKDFTVRLDPQRSVYWFYRILEQNDAKIQRGEDVCIAPRARKTEAELEGMRKAHARDGVALVRFMNWLESRDQSLSEIEAAQKLYDMRALDPDFRGLSFPSIAGADGHGAIIHYHATPESAADIGQNSVLLLDSGGQYHTGTTDITRVFAFGAARDNDALKRHYTAVLKGHLALKRARFPEGATGAQLDALARAPIWEEGLDYPHGTGHGVGVYGHVHEDAGVAFSPRSHEALKPGMILTDEPGYYREDHYGIRIENMLVIHDTGEQLDDGRAVLAFEDLTLAPYVHDLIRPDMLSRQEIDQIDAYHAHVYEKLAPRLDDATRKWLETATRPLEA